MTVLNKFYGYTMEKYLRPNIYSVYGTFIHQLILFHEIEVRNFFFSPLFRILVFNHIAYIFSNLVYEINCYSTQIYKGEPQIY